MVPKSQNLTYQKTNSLLISMGAFLQIYSIRSFWLTRYATFALPIYISIMNICRPIVLDKFNNCIDWLTYSVEKYSHGMFTHKNKVDSLCLLHVIQIISRN